MKCLLVFLCCFTSLAEASGARIPKGLQTFLKRVQKGVLWHGDFKQTDTLPGGSTSVSSGLVALSTPHSIRFETKKPDPQLLIGNGKKYWIYTPPFDKEEKGQLLVLPADAPQTKWAHLLLGGKLKAEDFESMSQKNQTFLLKPKPGSLGSLTQVELVLRGRPIMIQKLTLEYRSKNKSVLEFTNGKHARAFPEKHFEFVAPPGVALELLSAN